MRVTAADSFRSVNLLGMRQGYQIVKEAKIKRSLCREFKFRSLIIGHDESIVHNRSLLILWKIEKPVLLVRWAWLKHHY